MDKNTQPDPNAEIPIPQTQQVWPLYGAGFDRLGVDSAPIEVPVPQVGPDQLLVRHDACGLCFSDIKVIRLGEDHPRIYRDMQADPVILGHEVAMTVVKVGENLRDRYQPGDRFTLQADIYADGVGYAYGYEIQGGLSQYNLIDQRIINGDHGNYLIPIHPETGYAEAALVEPWACVIAAYILQYRTVLKPGGTTWFVGPEDGPFTLSSGFDRPSHPAKLMLTEMNGPFGEWLRQQALALGIPVVEVSAIEPTPGEQADDIVLLAPTPDLVETISPCLADHGILAFSAQEPFDRPANLDIGRVHYNRWLFLGGTERDIAALYRQTPVRSSLRRGGRALFAGAGGPMGRMHVQHAIETPDHPAVIVCTDISTERLQDLEETFAQEAHQKGIEWLCLNPSDQAQYRAALAEYDDILILAPLPQLVEEAVPLLAEGGVMNIFAGVARGTTAEVDLEAIRTRQVRIIGHSASSIEDMHTMLNKVECGELATNRSVAAVGSLGAAKDGLQALVDAAYPGKVVIFPNIPDLPLTRVSDLKDIRPDVADQLQDGRTWTKEAEQVLLTTPQED